jgi:hypothetical protein
MAKRNSDLAFGVAEALWRRVELKDIDGTGAVKPNKLRLQISVVRERYGERDHATWEKWNGVAEASAGVVAAVVQENIKVACVDEPDEMNPGHALIAMIVQPGDPAPEEMVNAARVILASKMKVVVAPTKWSAVATEPKPT